jgi:hypothetical protein
VSPPISPGIRWCSTITIASDLRRRLPSTGPQIAAGDRRAGRRQHEPDRAAACFPAGDARPVHGPRGSADLRRSDDRISCRCQGCARSLWHHSRSHDARQGDWRRHAGRCFRWPTRDHGHDRPARPGVPGRYPVRQSGSRRRRSGDAATAARRGFLRTRWRSAAGNSPTAWLRPPTNIACRSARKRSAACSGCISVRSVRRATPK